jgi:hypothetical protein
MKLFILAAVFCVPLLIQAQSHSLEKIWETDTVVAIPESVIPDAAHKFLFVSLIDGGGWDADGKGGVGKLDPDGKKYDPNWIKGLNAPKGLGLYGNRLYTADIGEVVVIDIKKGVIEKKIPIEGASGLNDITVDANGIVYVSDSRVGKVYRIEKDLPVLFMDKLSGANGLKAHGEELYVLANKSVLNIDAAHNIRTITTLPNGGDGVEEAGNGDLIVSEWQGTIYYVYADGRKELLLDRRPEKKNTADIHYDPATHILYVPGFNGKTVTAYRLKEGAGTGTGGTAFHRLRIAGVEQGGAGIDGGGIRFAAAPRVYLVDAARLEALKKKVMQGEAGTVKLAGELRDQADKFLDMKPVSVMEKSRTPMSGNKHDYMSQAPYFWYDSTKPNGLPYMRRDGQRNPEIYKITDRRYVGELDNAVRVLSMGWWLTGDEKYAQKAAVLLRHWFLDDSTKMNPNLVYAQAVPGINDGRGIGLIETVSLTGIADAAGLLEGSVSWTKKDAGALRQWYAQFLDWMLTSKNGKDEHAARNNHGTWYLVQATDFALYSGNTAKAKQLAEEGKALVEKQIQPDGKMPLELARTNGLGYSTFNLQAFFTLATLGREVGVDLWNYKNKEGAGIRTAFDWLLPYASGKKNWDYQQISPYNKNDLHDLLLRAALVYKDGTYREDAAGLGQKDSVMAALLWAE